VPQGLRGKVFVLNATYDQDRYTRRRLQELIYRVETLAIGEGQIREDRPYCFLAQSFHALRERLNPFTVEWAIFGVEECLSKDFRMSLVFVDQKEIAYISGHFQTNGIGT
jgi:hypothetical protein